MIWGFIGFSVAHFLKEALGIKLAGIAILALLAITTFFYLIGA
jgi:hypothetical protein